ncbi:hypothetical protein D9758_006566 [Tetrapyrgos nigripes]|uniref:Uncharacterized protein n=1 Tax=Tetrapyrgos nigripes TaxID=182062 RepID=A0A8H5GKR4_9AGAR|nr:hypothetical protein D9758_006566 [Tetrapyrgos nigripes]
MYHIIQGAYALLGMPPRYRISSLTAQSSLSQMATTQAILSNVKYHADLIQSLDSLSSVPDTLKAQVKLIQDLELQIEDAKEKVEKLKEITAEKRKIHEDVKGSMVMKTANVLVGRKDKYIAKVEREENGYTKALENEMQQRAKLEKLQNMVDEVSLTKLTLESKVERMQLLRNDISSLYSRVFNQPTAPDEFPRAYEAAKERKKAQDAVDSLQLRLGANKDAVTWLTEAKDLIYVCWRYIDEGLAQFSAWGTSGKSRVLCECRFTHMDRELRNAAKSGFQAESLIEQARRGEPSIQTLPPLVVYEPPRFSPVRSMEDMLRKDFPVTKAANAQLLSNVKKNREDLLAALDILRSDITSAKSRIKHFEIDLPEAEEALRKAEQEALVICRQIWDGVTSGKVIESGLGQPPSPSSTRSRLPSHPIAPPPYQMLASTRA